jgi:hypothetical protein
MELSYIIPYFIYIRSLLINNISEYKEEFYVDSLKRSNQSAFIFSSGVNGEEDEEDDEDYTKNRRSSLLSNGIYEFNDQKEDENEKDETSKKKERLNWKFYILSKLISPIFLVLLISVYFIFIFMMKVFIFLPNEFYCSGYILKSVTLQHLILALTIVVFGICFQWYDIFYNRKLIFKCKLNQYFNLNDPYYFRIDLFISIFSLSLYILLTALVTIYIDEYGKFITSIFMTFVFTSLLFSQVLLPLIITIYKTIISFNSSSVQNLDIIDSIFENEEIFELFLKHAKDELSSENIYAKIDIKKYKKSNQKESYALKFKKAFIQNSCLNLNVSDETLSLLSSDIESKKFTENLFDRIESEVDRNLFDTINRFSLSPRYKNYVKLKKFKNIMFDHSEKKNLLQL